MKFENPIEMFPTGSMQTPQSGYFNVYLDTEDHCGFRQGNIVAILPNGRYIRVRHE